MIPQSFIEEIQLKADIVEIISSYIPLKRTGRNFKALCPFHGEKTPSFIVSPQKQIFHCFGCGQGGGVLQFIMQMEKINFPETIEMLARKLGLPIPYEKTKTQKDKNFLYDVVDKAALYFHNNLLHQESTKHLLSYLEKRGIGNETIKKFKIGYAPANNALLGYMRKSGFTLDALEKTSLITSGKRGFSDLFRDRITFPILDVRSRTIGFGARAYKDTPNNPKYINSFENILYSKRENLFGLNFSKEHVSNEREIIVVEGYLDMITPFMRGVKNIVASLGTALTQEQIRLLKRYAQEVILVYDSDQAGKTATLRSLDLLLENDLRVYVVSLPEGFDPDSLVRKKGKDFFLKLIKEKKDFFEYKLDILKETFDLDTIKGKSSIATQMFMTIDKLVSNIEKYEYIRRLSGILKIREEVMIADYENNFLKKKNKRKVQNFSKLTETKGISEEPLSVTEKVLFKFMFTHPKAFLVVRKNLKEEYFSSYLTRKTISFFFNTLAQNNEKPISNMISTIEDEEISSFVARIMIDEDIPLSKEIFKESLVKMRKKGILDIKKKLKQQIQEAEIKGDRKLLEELIGRYGKINSEVRNG